MGAYPFFLTGNGTYHSSFTVQAGLAKPQQIPATVTVANTQSNVFVTLNAEPFVPLGPYAYLSAPATKVLGFYLTLSENAGVATRITSLKAVGVDLTGRLAALYGDSLLAPMQSRTAVIELSTNLLNLPEPFNFTSIDVGGQDVDSGAIWTRSLTLQVRNLEGISD